jgi:hypothetical protein
MNDKKEKLYYVYELIDPNDNKIFYIGKGYKERMYDHYNNVKNNKIPNEKNVYEKEKQLIKEIGLENLCNITIGWYRLNYKCSNKTRNKLSNSLKGRIPWNKGLKNCYSEETKRRISQSLKGKTSKLKGTRGLFNHSEETKEKISKSCKNRIFTGLHKNNISKSKLGKNHPMYGKHLCDEHKRKIGDGNRGKIVTNETKTKMSVARKNYWSKNNTIKY